MIHEDFEYYSEDETIHDDTFRQEKKNGKNTEDSHVMDEVISILKSLINIFDVISSHMKEQK